MSQEVVDVAPTEWGGWIARTPEHHRFRLAAVGSDKDAVVRDLHRAVEEWDRLANAAGGVRYRHR